MDMKTHEILNALYKRSGYSSYEVLAHKMGYAHASSIQRYFKEDGRKGKYLSADIVERFSNAFVGHGTPLITHEDVWRLSSPKNMIATQNDDINESLDALLKFYKKSTSEVKRDFMILMKNDSGNMYNFIEDEILSKKKI